MNRTMSESSSLVPLGPPVMPGMLADAVNDRRMLPSGERSRSWGGFQSPSKASASR
jgi:hypothetical protein